MKQRLDVREFGLRVGICLVIVGGLYGAWWLAFGRSHNLTPSQKIADLRAAVDTAYVTDGQLATFHENSAVSAYDLGSLESELQTNLQQVQTRLKAAPPRVSPKLRQSVQQFIGQEQDTLQAYTSASAILGHVIAYDPSTDLTSNISQRAAAAQKGLQQAANGSGSTGLSVNDVNGATQIALQQEAECFGQLVNDQSGLQHCIKQYPKARQAAISNLLSDSFSMAHRQQLTQTVPNILQSLDRL